MESVSSGVRTMHPGFDINKLRHEAQTRWMKPSEVLFILQNHERYPLTLEAPQKPPSGSLFLFNRRVLRFFRKDGYMWRKKKDGRTLCEAHERLKVGNVDALNCYYAHGEQKPYFQRRSYWMLDLAYEHIVLVHYREVDEGRHLSFPNLSTDSLCTFNQSTGISNSPFNDFTSRTGELHELYRSSSSPASVEEVSSKFAMEKIETDHLNAIDSSGQPEVNQALRKIEVQLGLDDDDDSINFGKKLPAHCTQYENSQNLGLSDYEARSLGESLEGLLQGCEYRIHNQVEDAGKQARYGSMELLQFSDDKGKQQIQSLGSGYNIQRKQSPLWDDMLELSSSSGGINTQGAVSNLLAPEDVSASPSCRISALETQFTSRDMLKNGNLPEVERNLTSGTSTLEANSSAMMLRKGNSTDWMGPIDLATEKSMYCFDLSGMWFDQIQFGNSLCTESNLTVAQEQRFSIREISPEWSFSSESTKVIITGDFLCNPSEFSWAVMFGDIEVPLDILQEGVLRCQAPPYSSGKVTLCVTSGNRESCSEIREFEFRAKPDASSFIGTSPEVEATKNCEELLLLVRFAHILLGGNEGSSTSKGGIEQETEQSRKLQTTEDRWQQIIEALLHGCGSPSETLEWILQELLKDKLQHWLMSKYHGEDGTACLLAKRAQGIIHMISGLGYEWALSPILDSGVGINFRDANGWTSLHWAARFGREKMVAALVAAGAAAGAVTDPTPQDPVGKTPGAISASSGHKGLAGYLSEVALNSHLLSITMEESDISKGSAAVETERAVENISDRNIQTHGETEDELSLRDSLAAVRNATLAAAHIQSAFRAHSFRRRQQKAGSSQDAYGMTPEDIHGLSVASKFPRAGHGYHDQKLDKAALSIQKKYRAWKGRKNFLIIRQYVVKIQAHVRGHQVRKKYKEFLWTVSVVEKVILRWRRRGVGLRGFRAEQEMIDETEDEDIVKVFRKQKVDAALDQAVSRVLSMVESPNARRQYRRMLERYRQAKAELSITDETATGLQDDLEILQNDYCMG